MKTFVKSLPFLLVMGACLHVACGDGETATGTTGVGPVGSQGSGFSPACNDDRRDGYCNALGQFPESCECLDCADSSVCNGLCNDNGMCDGQEDCTCQDCFSGGCIDPVTTVDQGQGPQTTAVTTTSATTNAGQGGGTTAATTAAGQGGMGGAGGS